MADREQSTKPRAECRRGSGKLTLGIGSSALILMITTAIVLMSIGTMAWLSSVRSVDSGSVIMDMDSDVFELAAPSPLPTPLLPSDLTSKTATTANSSTALHNYTIVNSAYDTASSLMLSLVPDNMPELRPGAYGTMKFYIVTSQSGLTLTFDLRRLLVPVEDEYGVAQTIPAAVRDFICGHILFFKSRDADGKYSDLIYTVPDQANGYSEGSFSVTATGAYDKVENGKYYYYPVTIYWVWPKNFRQMAEVDANGDTVLFPHSGSSDNTAPDYGTDGMRQWIRNYPGLFFKGAEGDNLTTLTTLMGYYINLPNSADGITASSKLILAYNLADQDIGDNVQYLVVELDAKTGDASGS